VHTEIISEIGVNWDGVEEKAFRLINAAGMSGADIVKFQMFDAELLGRPELKQYELRAEFAEELKNYAEEQKLEFLCTPFDVDSLWFLFDLGVKRLKISSGCITDHEMLRAAVKTGLPVIMSTGMCTHEQMWEAYKILGHPTILQCTSAYPCPLEDVNLRVLDRLPPPFGLSDHTEGITVALAAVGRGATMIEKHLTLDRKSVGPDHKASIEPHIFAAMVDGIREIEEALGDGQKRPMPSEEEVMRIWR
jgi:N,N'-diacetyllegionaminate synthase